MFEVFSSVSLAQTISHLPPEPFSPPRIAISFFLQIPAI